VDDCLMHADSSASEGSQTEPVTTGDEPPEPFHLLTPAGFVPADHQWLSDHLGQILGHLPSEVEQINIRLLDDAGMSELHQQWKGLEGPTDVLSWFHSSGDQPIEADLAIGLEVAAREAAQRGHPIRQELLLYIVHGILHGCGFDDLAPEAADRMHAEEDRILALVGVEATYKREASE
jgi:probable rRNA maturation factor|tara:strand:- start:203 stop:736 length:534 start_codon:yes stop_codon:yes gene_type:complete